MKRIILAALVGMLVGGPAWGATKESPILLMTPYKWAGLNDIQMTFHTLRHSHATQMLTCGIHMKVASERLGHSSIGITMDLYSHVLPGMQEEAAERVDNALRAALNSGSQTT